MQLHFRRLSDAPIADIIALNNNPDVLRQMPLGRPDFDERKCKVWVAQKEAQWALNGYGPWAFFSLTVNSPAGAACSRKTATLILPWCFIQTTGGLAE